MSDRGMKKWAPYSSLIEQATCLEEMKYKKNKVDKPILESDQIEKINFVLSNTKNGQTLNIKFYYDGYFYTVSSQLKRIDIENKILVLEDGKIKFDQLIDIENPSIC